MRGHLGVLGSRAQLHPEQQVIDHPYVAGPTDVAIHAGYQVASTLLMHPGGQVHVTTGLLPRKAIALQRDWFHEALEKLSPSFRVGPVLIDPTGRPDAAGHRARRPPGVHPARHADHVAGRPDPRLEPDSAAARRARRTAGGLDPRRSPPPTREAGDMSIDWITANPAPSGKPEPPPSRASRAGRPPGPCRRAGPPPPTRRAARPGRPFHERRPG